MGTLLGIAGLALLIVLFIISPLFLKLPLLFLLLIYILAGVRIINEYERGVLFTLGRYEGILGPGIHVIIPLIQRLVIVDTRVRTIDIPPQEVITRDNVSIRVNGIVFYRVIDPEKAVLNVRDYKQVTFGYAQTALRDVLGSFTLDDILERRDEMGELIRSIVDKKADEWGIDIDSIRIQDVILPEGMKRAMAVQAEAEREKRAVIIKSEGEREAATKYAEAAEILSKTPGALTLRTLQTVNDIAKDPSQKIVILLPIEILEALKRRT